MCTTLTEYQFRTSITLFTSEIDDPQAANPLGLGTGCIIYYRRKYFLISVDHVVNYEDHELGIMDRRERKEHRLSAYCENYDNGPIALKPIGGVVHFDLLKFNSEPFNIDSAKKVDFTFAEIKKHDLGYFLQREYKSQDLHIQNSQKIFLKLDRNINKPRLKYRYGVMGRLRSDFTTKFFLHKIAIRQDLMYVGSGGDYHIFKTETPFGTYRDWAGLSGGPVIEETG